MDQTISLDLIKQLIQLSDLSQYSQFVALYGVLFLTITSLIFLAFFFALNTHKKPATIPFLFYLFFVLFTLLNIFSINVQMNKLTLNKQQIVLLKSIKIPEFQILVRESIEKNGATIAAIYPAINKYKEIVIENKEKEEKNKKAERGQQGLALYDNTHS